MSAQRQADMADIQNAIETGITRRREEGLFRANVGMELKARGQQADDATIDATIAGANDQVAQDEQEDAANQARAAAQDKADQALALKRQSLIKAQALKAYRTSGRTLGRVKNGIGRIPMPTGLWLPVILLLTLLMLLIQINGNTRLGWLWLVMTGNAALPDTSTALTSIAEITTTVETILGNLNAQQQAKGGGGPPMMYIPSRSYELDEW